MSPPIIRAKFRCMSITAHWNDYSEIRLSAVRRDGKDGENDSFCQWTPQGEMRLMIKGAPVIKDGRRATALHAGAYYFIDFQRAIPAPGNWRLKARTERDVDGNVELNIQQWGSQGLQEGSFTMWCTVASTRELFGAPSQEHIWRVTLSFAEASDFTSP